MRVSLPSFSFYLTGQDSTVDICYTRTNSSAMDIRARNETTPVQGTWPHIPCYNVCKVYVFRVCVHTNWNFQTICTVLTPKWMYMTYIYRYEEQSRNALLSKSSKRRQIVQYSNRPTSRHKPLICSHSTAVNCNVTRWIKIPSFKKVCLNVCTKIARPLVRFSQIITSMHLCWKLDKYKC